MNLISIVRMSGLVQKGQRDNTANYCTETRCRKDERCEGEQCRLQLFCGLPKSFHYCES